jgi:flagellin
MGVRIFTNIDAMNADRQLGKTSLSLSKSIQRLSSGLRINSAADDAAGLGISERLRSQVKGDQQAVRNAQDGISLFQTAEGALDEVHSMLQRARELTVQAANGTLSSNDINSIGAELSQLGQAIDRIGNTTQFNTQVLLDGNFNGGSPLTLQVGANANVGTQDYTLGVTMLAMTTTGMNAAPADGGAFLGIDQILGSGTWSAVGANVQNEFTNSGTATVSYANQSLITLDLAINAVSAFRGELGAKQNALEHTVASLNVAAENQAAAESRIRDLDVANQTVEFTKLQILQQAGTAVLAQANVAPQTVLQLLR